MGKRPFFIFLHKKNRYFLFLLSILIWIRNLSIGMIGEIAKPSGCGLKSISNKSFKDKMTLDVTHYFRVTPITIEENND